MHGVDINRLREWALEHNSQFYRQTVLLTSWLNADMNRLFSSSSYCCNYEGQVRSVCVYLSLTCSLSPGSVLGVCTYLTWSLKHPGAHSEPMYGTMLFTHIADGRVSMRLSPRTKYHTVWGRVR